MVSRSLVILFATVTVWAQTATSPLAFVKKIAFLPKYANPNPS